MPHTTQMTRLAGAHCVPNSIHRQVYHSAYLDLCLTKPLASVLCGGGGLRWFLTRPRFHSRHLALTNAVRDCLPHLGVSPVELAAALATASRSPGRDGRECCATNDYYFVLAGDTIIHATTARAADPQRAARQEKSRRETAQQERSQPKAIRPAKSKRRRRLAPVPTTQRTYLKLLRAHGFELHPGRKHIKITHPDHPHSQCVMPKSSSDFRWIRNNIRDVNYAFGVDLRRDPVPSQGAVA